MCLAQDHTRSHAFDAPAHHQICLLNEGIQGHVNHGGGLGGGRIKQGAR